MFGFREKVYVDRLAEYRVPLMVGGKQSEYCAFDEVEVLRTANDFNWEEYGSPYDEPQRGVLLSSFERNGSWYFNVWIPDKSDRWAQSVKPSSVRPYYGEFHKEFTAIRDATNDLEEVERLGKRMKELKERAEQRFSEWRAVADANLKNVHAVAGGLRAAKLEEDVKRISSLLT